MGSQSGNYTEAEMIINILQTSVLFFFVAMVIIRNTKADDMPDWVAITVLGICVASIIGILSSGLLWIWAE